MDGSPRSERVLSAFAHVDRRRFLSKELQHLATADESITAGYNQTTSQPSMLAFMFDKLKINAGDRILEIGTGPGYAAAVVSQLCGKNGMVYTIETVPELARQARENLGNCPNIKVLEGDGSLGYADYAPYNRIFLSAGTGPNFNPEPLLSQLADGGSMLVPRRFGELFLYVRENNTVKKEVFYTVCFVRLCGVNSGWQTSDPGTDNPEK
ncbi:MAG: hypothetical protein JW874_16345 [Spirochaetales bacterium]|nr:hypothetical protein [Spirochaetales bacterium]